GLLRDSQGRKMSKSLGNGIDPVDVINQYGADALRFTLVTGNSPGNDARYSEEKVAASRNFANKIWNAARFIHMNIDGHEVPCALPETLTLEDQWIVSRFNTVTQEVTENLDKFELRSEEHTSELQSRFDLVCRLLLEKKKKKKHTE